MSDWIWRCLVCGKEMVIEYPGDDSRATWPNVNGATATLHFGYGSEHDQLLDRTEFQACVCDSCYAQHRDRVRPVETIRYAKWEGVSE